jgi:hypothetical protein
MMVKQKPVVYPSLVETMNSAVNAYQAVHDAVGNHAEEHRKVLDERRRALALQQSADKLLKSGTPSTPNTAKD